MSTPITINGPGRYRLRTELKLECSQVCPPGKIMFWSGRRHLGTSDLNRPLYIPPGCTWAALSKDDYQRVME